MPDLSFGLNVELSYKNFDLQMFWQGVLGQDVYNNQKFQNDFWSVTDAGSNKGVRVLDAWLPNVNQSSTIPMLTTNNTGDEGRTSSYFVENGSYAKLRTLQLGYSLPDKLLSKLRICLGTESAHHQEQEPYMHRPRERQLGLSYPDLSIVWSSARFLIPTNKQIIK